MTKKGQLQQSKELAQELIKHLQYPNWPQQRYIPLCYTVKKKSYENKQQNLENYIQ